VVRGLVAEEERELVHVVRLQSFGLQPDGAIHQPVVFRHILYQEFFRGTVGCVVRDEGLMEGFECGGIFVR